MTAIRIDGGWFAWLVCFALSACASTRYVPPEELTVDFVVDGDIAQFAPGSFTFCIRLPSGESSYMRQAPWIVFHRWQDGEWGGLGYPNRVCGDAHTRRRFLPVRFDCNRPFCWQQEVKRWKVVAVPGRYRARVRYLLGNEQVFRYTDWTEFSVVAPTEDDSPLRTPQSADGGLWRDYVKFMERPMQPDLALDTGMRPAGGGGEQVTQTGQMFIDMLQQMHGVPRSLFELEQVPAALRRRMELFQLLEQGRAVRLLPEPAARADAYGNVKQGMATLAREHDLYGRLASAVAPLVGRSIYMGRQGNEPALEPLSPATAQVAVTYPILVQAFGRLPPSPLRAPPPPSGAIPYEW